MNRQEIEDYLNDFDNLIETGHFPNKEIGEYTFKHKTFTLKQFIQKGREIIRLSLLTKEPSLTHTEGEEEKHLVVVCSQEIDLKQVTDIYDIERDKKMFLNRDAGFIIQFKDGSKKSFSERIPYDSFAHEITDKKAKWWRIEKNLKEEWQKHKHTLPEFK